jgi:hypothetical protein
MHVRACCIALVSISLAACNGPPEYLVIEEYSGDPMALAFRGVSCDRVGGGTGGSGAGGEGVPSYSLREAPLGDGIEVVVSGQGGTLAERKYDSSFLHSGRVDDFTLTLAPGYVLRLRICGSSTCSLSALVDAALPQSD